MNWIIDELKELLKSYLKPAEMKDLSEFTWSLASRCEKVDYHIEQAKTIADNWHSEYDG